jgi:hypothetical protein
VRPGNVVTGWWTLADAVELRAFERGPEKVPVRDETLPASGAKARMAASWAVIWDSVCDFLHGKSQALSEGSAVKPAIRGSPTYSQSFTAQSKTTSKPFKIIMGKSEWFSSPWVCRRLMGTRLKSCPDTKQSFSAAYEARPLLSRFSLPWVGRKANPDSGMTKFRLV